MKVGFISQIWAILANLRRSDAEGLHYLSVLFVILAIFSLSGLCLGDNVEYCYDHPFNDSADWSENITAQMFDPRLGELSGAQIIMNFTIMQDVNVSNKRDLPVNMTFNAGGNLSLTLPDKRALHVEFVNNRTLLSAPNKEMVFSESGSKNQSISLDESQLKKFIASSPGETIMLPLVAVSFGSFEADGALWFGVTSKSRASICILYHYSPAGSEKIGAMSLTAPTLA